MKGLTKLLIFNILITTLFITYLFFHDSGHQVDQKILPEPTPKKKVLYVNSYHKGYEWSDGIEEAILSTLKIKPTGTAQLDNSESEVELKIVEMNTKRKKSLQSKQEAAQRVNEVLQTWKPDLVITSDDNAVQHVILPFLNNTSTPVVFCGVNWNLDLYNLATNNNITGMIEIAHFKQLISTLLNVSEGKKIGYISGLGISDKKEVQALKKISGIDVEFYAVENFRDWKDALIKANENVDVLLINNYAGIDGWNKGEALRLINSTLTIPTGSSNGWMKDYNLATFAKSPREQGEWAARTALNILHGLSPHNIAVTTSTQAKIYLNMTQAKRLNIIFPMDLIENSTMISEKQNKILYVSSYHQGYLWSDDIEKGLLEALSIEMNADGSYNTSGSIVELKTYRMNTKLNKSEPFKRQAALTAKALIESWEPDLIIASDDNASKYLIAPYYKESTLPVIFCGVNLDASGYGFPTSNITGMIETSPYQKSVNMLRPYSKGNIIGVIGSNDLTSNKEVEYLKTVLPLKDKNIRLLSRFDEWKKEYVSLQEHVDMIIWLNPIGMAGWDQKEAERYILNNTKIPTCGTSDNNVIYALLGNVKIGKEQGLWSGKTALQILLGKSPSDIALATNKHSKLYINMALANRLGIKFSLDLLNKAEIINPY